MLYIVNIQRIYGEYIVNIHEHIVNIYGGADNSLVAGNLPG